MRTISKLVKDIPLETEILVANEMAFIELIHKLGYREEKMWDDNDPEDSRIFDMLMYEAMQHTKEIMKILNKKL